MPVMCRFGDDPVALMTVLSRTFRYLFAAVFFLALALGTWPSDFIRLLYGPNYVGGATVLSILAWAEGWIFLGGVMRDALVVVGKQRLTAVARYSSAMLNVALNLVMIPRLGIAGAAWASMISYWVASCVFLLVFRESRPFVIVGLRAMVRPAAIAGALALVGSVLPAPVIIGLPTAGVLYVIALIRFGGLAKEDWKLLVAALNG
jgi:O-antigen/teichoic acid export membrane protein